MKTISYLLKICAFAMLIFIWEYIFVHYQDLPDMVPIHFDLHGNADRFGAKNFVWIGALVATFIFLFVFYLSKNTQSQLLNLPENIKSNPETAGLIMDIFNVIMMIVFAVLTYESINVGLRLHSTLSTGTNYLLAVIFLFIIGIVAYSYFISKRKTFEKPTG